jgi:small subunit ribosomal protein S6
MYILDPSLDEDASGALMGKIEELMNKQGVEVEKIEPWGKRRLAYPIKGHKDGTYILSYLNAEPTAISEMERRLRVTDGILRFLTVRMDERQAKLERRKARAADKSVARKGRKAARTPAEAKAASPAAAKPEAKAASPAEAKPEAKAASPAEAKPEAEAAPPAETKAATDDTKKES